MKDFIRSITKDAGLLAKSYFKRGVTGRAKRNLADLVTDADTAVNSFLIEKIQSEYPDHAIHSEEAEDINEGASYEWVIDPIDGTRNFASGIPFWCTMVALTKDGELELAAIANPIADELFFAERDKGASLNGMPISVNEVDSFEYAFGIPVRGEDTEYDKEFKLFLDNITNSTNMWMHNYGSMLAACYVATGGADFYAGNCGFYHDYAAATLIAREAGAKVTDLHGNHWERGRRDIVIANPALHKKLLPLFS